MKNTTNIGLLILRVGFSCLLMAHGIPKLQMLLKGGEIQFPNPIGVGVTLSLILAIIGEAIAPLFIIAGYKTKWAAIFPALTMAVAFFIFHAADPIEKKELPLLYLIAFVSIALLGAGKYSVDGRKSK